MGLPRSTVVYHGLPDYLEEADTQRDSAENGPIFAYVGRLTGEKGLPLLIQACAQLKKEGKRFEIRFVGDGRQRRELEEMCAEQGLQDVVAFTGFLTGERLAECLKEVDAVVMPSVWEETAGLAAMEQMMRGRLVIAADIGGLGEVVGDGGLKFAPGDFNSLATRMRDVIDRPEIVRELGAKARSRATVLFRQERMVEEHVRLYLKVFQRV
jgi:glycosyltransferase involved in cell wall biosynthesis